MKNKHKTGILMAGSAVFAALFLAIAAGMVSSEAFALEDEMINVHIADESVVAQTDTSVDEMANTLFEMVQIARGKSPASQSEIKMMAVVNAVKAIGTNISGATESQITTLKNAIHAYDNKVNLTNISAQSLVNTAKQLSMVHFSVASDGLVDPGKDMELRYYSYFEALYDLKVTLEQKAGGAPSAASIKEAYSKTNLKKLYDDTFAALNKDTVRSNTAANYVVHLVQQINTYDTFSDYRQWEKKPAASRPANEKYTAILNAMQFMTGINASDSQAVAHLVKKYNTEQLTGYYFTLLAAAKAVDSNVMNDWPQLRTKTEGPVQTPATGNVVMQKEGTTDIAGIFTGAIAAIAAVAGIGVIAKLYLRRKF